VDNLVALVTGANKGIGKEIARQFADAGLTVYLGSRDAARGEHAVEEIGGDTRLLVLDVTDDASIADAVRQVGSLDPGPLVTGGTSSRYGGAATNSRLR
jgi:NAD(P)-dependent dehydrogenase (short-subunit alcohol dehydrogenase family)